MLNILASSNPAASTVAPEISSKISIIDELLALPEQIGGFLASLAHWLRNDSLAVANAMAQIVVLFALFMAGRWLIARIFGGKSSLGHWRGIVSRVFRRTHALFLLVLAIRIISHFTPMPEQIEAAFGAAFTIALVFQGAVWARELILAMIERGSGDSGDDDMALASAMGVITILVNTAIFIVALILVLDNLGVNVTALIAGLGVGGIAIGLAAQGIFSDLFAALSILFDRPFRIGDTITFGTTTGVVEQIGLKSTSVRALSGEQVIISNKNLLNLPIFNLNRISARRVVAVFHLALDTPIEKLALVPAMAQAAVEKLPDCHLERAHITFVSLFAIEVEIAFHNDVTGIVNAMDARQALTLTLLHDFAAAGVNLASNVPPPTKA